MDRILARMFLCSSFSKKLIGLVQNGTGTVWLSVSFRDTWHISYCTATYCIVQCIVYSVSQKIPPPDFFLTFFPKRLGIFSQNFTHLLYLSIYARLQIFIQLPATFKSHDIKRDHHYVLKMSTIG